MYKHWAPIVMGILFSFISLLLLALHLALPILKIDSIVIALLILASTPWILPILKSLELPGGVKIEFTDVKAAMNLATMQSSGPSSPPPKAAPILEVASSNPHTEFIAVLSELSLRDPNLALVGFRIELEKHLRNIAQRLGIDSEKRSLMWIIRDLQQRGILSIHLSMGIGELVTFGNQAAHGATVTAETVEWVLDASPYLFQSLKDIHDSIPVTA